MNAELLLPEIAVGVIATAILLYGAFSNRKEHLHVVSALSLIVPGLLTIWVMGGPGIAFGGALVADPIAIFFKVLLLGATFLVCLASGEFVLRRTRFVGEYYALLLFSAAGMMLMASTRELVSLYISLELATIPLFALAGLFRDDRSTEAGLKYLVLGGLSSAMLLFGMAYVFGLTGTTHLDQIAANLRGTLGEGSQLLPALMLAIAFMVGGLGFKISAVPFQMWAPDVYEGAPTPVTAFLSVGSKAAGYAMLLRIFYTAFVGLPVDWGWLFAVLSVLSMTVGNVVALLQNNIKRMMAYSSIAQAGYILVGVAVASATGLTGVLFFIASYAVTNLGAFIAIIVITDKIDSEQIPDFAGVAQRAPWLAAGLTLCLLSLVGIPPTSGFVAKFYLFGTAAGVSLWWLVGIGVLNSVISAYYYLRVAWYLYLGQPAIDKPIVVPGSARLAMSLAVAGVIAIFLLTNPLLEVARTAAAGVYP